MIKSFFGGKGKKSESDKELSVEDLVTLERYDEAEEMLKARLKVAPKDLYAHLKLAEVYVALKNANKALDEYTFVADSYAEDGFFDKGIALLGKAARISPADDIIPRRIERYQRMKRLEHRRRLAIEGLLANETARVGKSAGNTSLEVELLWNKIAKSHLVEQLEGELLKRLFSAMDMVRWKQGAEVAERGSDQQVMYLLVDGVVEASATIGGKPVGVRSFSTGDLIGDSALLERKPWPATYKVLQAATGFKLGREGLEKVMVGNADPVGFLSALRLQHNDRDVAVAVQKLGG